MTEFSEWGLQQGVSDVDEDTKIYSRIPTVIDIIEHNLGNDLLLIRIHNECCLDFILLESYSSNADGTNKTYQRLCEGSGVQGLRECRHTYFYPDEEGYSFYYPKKLFDKMFKILEEYFDFD